ncbi:MAG TPA: ethanolamine utilization protein EutN [Planctomycetes bacterium]|nr:ethanolamine utilization protein EutN [Planctomycetota bacterium]HIN81050.1 ethanolamine utilization protein EutN [Planctomycetota bacterium]
MFYGRVVGTVWATRKDPALEGMSLMLVQRVRLDGSGEGTPLVAVDSVSAGVGDPVLVAQGSSARQTELTRDRPVDAVIMAVIEGFDVPGGATEDA